ncbi:hypothetical protein FACS189468_9160 [Spirochaetia bacterium]|nr:hypothetical protein FACS189468_9160 [Spirochaetia bacterium]
MVYYRHFVPAVLVLTREDHSSGGEYQNESQVLVGSMTSRWAEIFMSDTFFIGADGFTEKYGFTGKDHRRTQTLRDMAEQAGEIIRVVQ